MTNARPRIGFRGVIGLGAIALFLGAFAGIAPSLSATAAGTGPCDLYSTGGTPCVAAFSSARALYGSYNGPLYQIKRASDGATRDVGLLSAGGYADASQQTAFCAGTTCTIPKIYDQSSNHNDLTTAPAGDAGAPDSPANAAALPITVAGHAAFGIYMPPGVAYRRSSTVTIGTARGSNPESMYEIASGTNANSGCCSDFGNVETLPQDTGAGHMDTINVSTLNAVASTGRGPWVQADLEEGVFEGHTAVVSTNTGNASKFVTAMLKNNGVDTFALKGGNAQAGGLSTWFEGALPDGQDHFGQHWKPMSLEGSIGLGAGGDNSNRGTQSFFEGAMTTGYATAATENAVQANIVAQSYQGVSTGGGPGREVHGPGGKCIDVAGDDLGGNQAVVQLWDCQDLAADQHWVGSAFGDGTLNTLGRCLDIDGNSTVAGTGVELYDCNGVNGQQWTQQADGTLKNTPSGLCLDSPNGATANGTALRIWTCNGSAAQQFTITAPLRIPISGSTSKCVDIDGNDVPTNGQKAQVWDCLNVRTGAPGGFSEALDQQWTYNVATQSLQALGRCLEVTGNSTTPGAKTDLSSCTGVGGQHWVMQSNGSILNPASGLCLDDPSGIITNGTGIQIWTCNGAPAQRFLLN